MNINKWLACSALALPLAIGMQHANAQSVDPDKLPKVGCTELTFSHDFLAKYPKAPAACQEARVYKGKRYAKFNGKVSKKDASALTVQVFNVAGDPLDTISVKPSATATVVVNGERSKLADLKVGDPLTFWVAETRYSFYSSPGKGASQVLPPQH
jgi:hypothetical protein